MARDMTDREFQAALKRNGFGKPTLFWVTHEELPNHHFSMLFFKGGKIAKRATVAHLIKRRDEELAKLEAKNRPSFREEREMNPSARQPSAADMMATA